MSGLQLKGRHFNTTMEDLRRCTRVRDLHPDGGKCECVSGEISLCCLLGTDEILGYHVTPAATMFAAAMIAAMLALLIVILVYARVVRRRKKRQYNELQKFDREIAELENEIDAEMADYDFNSSLRKPKALLSPNIAASQLQ